MKWTIRFAAALCLVLASSELVYAQDRPTEESAAALVLETSEAKRDKSIPPSAADVDPELWEQLAQGVTLQKH